MSDISYNGNVEKDWSITIGDLSIDQMSVIEDSIVSLNVSYSMSMVTQVTATLIDPHFFLTRNNYFIVGRDVIYRTMHWLGEANIDGTFYGDPAADLRSDNRWLEQKLEIASVQVGPGPGSSPSITLEMRTKAVQQMRRDKNPGAIKGNGSDWVIAVAKQYKLDHSVQRTTKNKQINKASGDQQADSTWTVLENLANDAKFLLFECDGRLFFVSQHRLIGKWGIAQLNVDYIDPQTNRSSVLPFNVIPLEWPPNITASSADLRDLLAPAADMFKLHQCPQLRQSEDDPLAADGNAQVDYVSGTALRPGMTVMVFGVPMFQNRPFLITEVSFDHLSREPVSISFASPEREDGKIMPYQVGSIFQAIFSG